MLNFNEPQIEIRARKDREVRERAYAELASSVSSAKRQPRITVDDVEQVDGTVKACLKYLGVQAGEVPPGITDLYERLDWLCRPSNTMYREVQLTGDWYKQAFGAHMGRLVTGERVALLPRATWGYYYLEPGTGRKVKVNARNASDLRSKALYLYRPFPAHALTLRDITGFILRSFDRSDYMLVVVAAVVATLIGMLPAWANQVAFGVVVPSGKARMILPIACLLVGMTISTVLISVFRNLVTSRMNIKLDVITQAATFSRVLSLPTPFFKGYASGNLAHRVASVSQLTAAILDFIFGTGLNALLSLVYVFEIGFFAPSLAIPAFVTILAQVVLINAVTTATMRYERLSMKAEAQLSGTVTLLLNGIQKLKLAGAEDRAFAKWAHDYASYARATYNRPPLLRAVSALVGLLGMLGTISIYYFAAVTNVSLDNYMAFNTAFGQACGAIMLFGSMAQQAAQIRPLLELIGPIMETPPETDDMRPSVTKLTGGIVVSNVSFRYDEKGPYVLDNLSFSIRAGEYVAIVGRSGCGKSTIVRLLLGFEMPERGGIYYGPHDVSKVNLRSLRQHIGTVTQDGRLVMGDIFSNITIAAPGATLDDAWEAAVLAGIADDIEKMPMGMQTILTEGSGGISGGQRQRIMIARAVCGKRRILMLDEATSALDNKTQRHVYESLAKLKCTRIVVAHRLSTVKDCDRILVLDGGRIAEEGTYEQLIERNGLFAELVARQRLER